MPDAADDASDAVVAAVAQMVGQESKGLPYWLVSKRLKDEHGLEVPTNRLLQILRDQPHEDVLVMDGRVLSRRRRRMAQPGTTKSATTEPAAALSPWDELQNDVTLHLSDVSLDVLRVAVWPAGRDVRSQSGAPVLLLRQELVDDGSAGFWLSLPTRTSGLLKPLLPTRPSTLSPGWRLPLVGVAADHETPPQLLVWRRDDTKTAAAVLRSVLEEALELSTTRVTLTPENCTPAEADRRIGARASIARVRAKRSGMGGYAEAFCDKCGQPLNNPESVRIGVGPECRRYYSPEYFRAMERGSGASTRMLLGAKKANAWLSAVRLEYQAG